MGKEIADLTGRVALVTGATSGIGKEAARSLARMGATTVITCRSKARGEEARKDLLAVEPNARIELLEVDLARQASIRSAAEDFLARFDRLDILLNNAGVWSEEKRWSEDGIELTFATNHLAYFLLTNLLLDRLKASAPSRIVNVSSRLARGLDLDDVNFDRRVYDGTAAYAQSKQANRMFTWGLDARLRRSGVTANAVHPGSVDTSLFRDFRGLRKAGVVLWLALFTRSAAKGADTPVWVASDPALEGVSGRYFADRKERRCPYRDPADVERLWALSERMTGLV